MAWNLNEALAYYSRQGAPAEQQALVALLREVQDENGGAIPAACLAAVADGYGLKETFLAALIKRIPSLCTEEAPHCLQLCCGPACKNQKAAQLARFVESAYQVKPGGVSGQGNFSYKLTGCMKHCGRGPNIKWDGAVHEKADEALLRDLINGGSA